METRLELASALLAAWLLLGLLSFVFFRRHKDAGLKRKASRWLPIGTGVLLPAVVLALSGRPRLLLAAIPAVILFTWLSVRLTRFCDACGAMLHDHLGLARMAFCARCGAKLTD